VVSADGRAVGEEAEGLDNRLRSVKSDLTHTEKGDHGEAGGPNGLTYDQAVRHVELIVREAVDRAKRLAPDLFQDAKVFVGCPALWLGRNRRKIVEICKNLGLSVSVGGVLDEPVAAGVEWINAQWRDGNRVHGDVLIVDAGGGTLDVAYLRVATPESSQNDPTPTITLLSAESTQSSGDSIDRAIADHLAETTTSDLARDEERAWLDAGRQLKEALSAELEAAINVAPPVSRVARLGRTKLGDLAGKFLSESERKVKHASRASLLRGEVGKRTPSPMEIRRRPWDEVAAKLDHVVVVGGIALMPPFIAHVKSVFPDAELHTVGQPQEVVARGLCYGETIIELNLPRPPIEFYAQVGNDPPLHIYEAFSPLYASADIALGRSHLGYRWSKETDSLVRIYAVLPNAPGEKVRFKFTNRRDSDDTAVDFEVKGDTRCASGSVIFELYATGELLIAGANKRYLLNVKDWAQTPASASLGRAAEAERRDREENPQHDDGTGDVRPIDFPTIWVTEIDPNDPNHRRS
jgi:hypothetical protein